MKVAWHRADSRFAPSQWETALLRNNVSHWLGANLEPALMAYQAMLTHLSLNKMAAILQLMFFRCIFVNEKFYILTKISLKFVPKGLIDNNASLVWLMAWRQSFERMVAYVADAYMWHSPSVRDLVISKLPFYVQPGHEIVFLPGNFLFPRAFGLWSY